MKPKKILGIILAVLLGTLFAGGIFMLIFVVLQNRGYALWFSVLMGIIPFIVTAILLGVSWLIVFLLQD